LTAPSRTTETLEADAIRRKAIIDRIAVLTFALAWLTAALVLAPQLDPAQLLLAGPIGVLGGYLFADFLAGAVHWLADRYFDPETPVLGPMLIAPFREHHTDPRSISRHDFFEVSGNNALVSIPLPLLLFLLPAPTDYASTTLLVFGLSASLALVATNLFHGWAHAEDPPRITRLLQRFGLILTPSQHARHHAANHDRAYCVTSGWLNPLLDRIQFFDRIEGLIALLSRTPRKPTSLDAGAPHPDPTRSGSEKD